MTRIRLVNGHFDGHVEAISGEPRQLLPKRLPFGEWVDYITGKPVTHDIYHLTTDENSKRVYTCTDRAIEKASWLRVQALKSLR